MKLLALALIVFSQTALAIVCNNKNFITEPNSPFQKIPVYDQDGANICFAYSAAQLMDYHLIKQGRPSRSVHPLWAALMNAKRRDRFSGIPGADMTAGNGSIAMAAVLEGNCPYDAVASALSNLARAAKVTESELIRFINVYTTNYRSLYQQKRPQAILDNTTVTFDDMDYLLLIKESAKDPIFGLCAYGATWEQLLPHLRALNALSEPEFFEKLVLPNCQGQISPINLPRPMGLNMPPNDLQALDTVSNRIDALNAPVAIQYCSRFLRNPGHVGILRRNPLRNADIKNDCEVHESIVAGKKQVGDTCQLLIRNTWGSNFSKWTDSRKCLCRHKQTGQYVDDCTKAAHNNGQFTVEGCWIDENSMAKNLLHMNYLEPRP